MDAASQRLTALLTNASQRFIIPVYQRPYSWDEEQCVQLWDDVLACGRRGGEATHFTGSVVWVQQGVMSASGITPVLVIDGQQRITTLTLLLIALAEHARAHPQDDLAFSCEEILGTGYLVNRFKRGDDHYKLTLSQGDRDVLRAIVDHLEDPETPLNLPEESRLVRNLAVFRERIDAVADPNSVWMGIQRLQIVSISLDQGRDNPQLIFESMNSTGKDLATADLIRNYVLMSQTAEEQERLYRNHWRVIEETLGRETYGDVFDDFIRNWLTVLYAPEPLVKRDVYALFKRHVADNGYDRDGRIASLLEELERFAGYYAAITDGRSNDEALRVRLRRIARLRATVANPLLLSFFDDYDHGAFSHEDFVSLLDTLESYLLRRAVCDCPTNSLNKYFSSVIAKLNAVQDEGGNYREAFEAFLQIEAGTPRRFPADSEFFEALKTRNCYGFQRSLYVLSRLENSYHPKDERDFATGTYSIEHIMPQNALAHDEWREMLGPDCEELHAQLVHALGNLTLTAYNSELSDASFAQKKARMVGGYDVEFISISADLRQAEVWNAATITARSEKLAHRALEVWPAPALSAEVLENYAPRKKDSGSTRVAKFKDLFNAGTVEAGLVLAPPVNSAYVGSATVTETGTIRLDTGEEFASPSLAAIRAGRLAGGAASSRNGWHYWRLPDGRPLDELRRIYLAQKYDERSATEQKRIMYWDGFFDYCSGLPGFVEAFGDPLERQATGSNWTSFSIGTPGCQLETHIAVASEQVELKVYCTNLNTYDKLHAHVDVFETLATDLDASFRADNAEKAIMQEGNGHAKKTRSLYYERPADFDTADWESLYAWHAKGLLRLRALILKALG